MPDWSPTIKLREKALFIQALAIESPEERAGFLDEACGDDRGLRARLEHLLCVSDRVDGFLDPSQYDGLIAEQDLLTQELFEEGRFLSELGHTIRHLGDDYELLEEIGRGAAGVVFRAYQTSLRREVAVKVILGSALSSPAERERFQAEAEAAAGLNHPNIVPVYEVGRQDNHDYYSMALMRGGTLSASIRRGVFTLREAVRVMITISRTVHAAHRGGIIHRDLKPDNILLNAHGEPHISDFGLAYHIEQQKSLTITRGIQGTPHFMAPEQADPELGPVTTSTDVYSLGAILYQLLTGMPPFQHDSLLQVLQMVKDNPPRPLRSHNGSVDRDLETIVHKCLEKQPARRYDSARTLADDLEAWLEGRPIAARPPTTTERVWKWARRRPTHAMLVAITVLFVLTLGIGGPLVAIQQSKLRVAADLATEIAEDERLATEAQRQAAISARAAADRSARESRSLAYSYSTRLAASVANTDRDSLASHGILRTLLPAPGQDDLRGWEWYYLYADVYLTPRRFNGGGQPVDALGFSPSGRLVASAYRGRNGSVLRDGSHGATIRTLNDPSGSHRAFLWSTDDSRLVTVSDGGAAKVWDPSSGRELAQLPAPVLALGGWLAEGRLIGLTDDNVIRVWDVADLSAVSEVSKTASPTPGLRTIALSPDGLYLAGASDVSDVFLWPTDRLNEPPRVLSGHSGAVFGLAWHRDSRWLASLSEDTVVRVWEVPGGARLLRLWRNETRVNAIAWDPNGMQFLFGGENGFFWHMDLVTSQREKIGEYPVAVTELDWCGVTHSFVVGLADGSIEMKRFGLPDPSRMLYRHEAGWSSIQWSTDGSELAGRTSDGKLLVVDATTGKVQSDRFQSPRRPVRLVGWMPDSDQRIATITATDAGSALGIVQPSQAGPPRRVKFPALEVTAMCWGPDHETVVTLTDDGAITASKMLKDRQARTFQKAGDRSAVFGHISLSPDHRLLLATGDPAQIGIWDYASGRRDPWILPDGTPEPVTHAWHPDAQRFATGNADGSVSVWDPKRRSRLAHFETPSDTAPQIDWHPDGTRLASGGDDAVVHLWDWRIGESPLSLKHGRKPIAAVAWSPDGMRLATVSAEAGLRVWDATAGYLMNSHEDGHRSKP